MKDKEDSLSFSRDAHPRMLSLIPSICEVQDSSDSMQRLVSFKRSRPQKDRTARGRWRYEINGVMLSESRGQRDRTPFGITRYDRAAGGDAEIDNDAHRIEDTSCCQSAKKSALVGS